MAFNDSESRFYKHPSVLKLHESFKLEYHSGYISLINPFKESHSSTDLTDWVLFDVRFGIPLFDRVLNKRILTLFKENKQGCLSNLRHQLESNRALSLRLIDYIQTYQTINVIEDKSTPDQEYLIRKFCLLSPLKKHNSNTVIYPTQCVLFQSGKTSVYTDFGD